MTHLLQTPTRSVTRLWSLATIMLLLPCVVLAGGKATMVTTNQSMQIGGQSMGNGSNTMNITWHDADTMRMDFSDDTGYLIVRDGKTYSVSDNDGETQVMDMSSMMKMMQTMGGQNSQTQNSFGNIDSVKATGETETVAGIKGRVYLMTWTEPDRSNKSGDAVLTDDPLVVEMTRAYISSMAGMIGADATRSFQDALPDKDRGLLRMDDQMRVESVSRTDPPASTFELPAKPMDLQGLMGGMMGR